MSTQLNILRAFLTEKLGSSLDEETFMILEEHISMAEIEQPESEEIRSVDLKLTTDGKITGSMFSFYNITRLSLHDLFKMVLNAATGLLANETKVKIIAACNVIHHVITEACFHCGLIEIDFSNITLSYYFKVNFFV
jgi:hypothetical protein